MAHYAKLKLGISRKWTKEIASDQIASGAFFGSWLMAKSG
jgi:hypothetical protein